MIPYVQLVIPGEPVAKARPRLSVRGGTYTPLRTQRAEDRLVSYLKASYPHLQPSDASFGVRVTFHVGSDRRVDTDNLLKLILDAGNHRIWSDDSQVKHVEMAKVMRSHEPRTEIAIFELEESPNGTTRRRRDARAHDDRRPTDGRRPDAGRIADLDRRIANFRARLRRLEKAARGADGRAG